MTKEQYLKYLDMEIKKLKRQKERQKEIKNECKKRQCFVVYNKEVSA